MMPLSRPPLPTLLLPALLAGGLLLASSPGSLVAQGEAWQSSGEGSGEAPSREALPTPVEAGAGPIAALLGGVHGTNPGAHLFGGVNAGYMASRWAGGEGVVLGGRGSGYSSLLAGAGPTLRFASGDWGEARLWVGGGWYREGNGLPPGGSATTATRASGVAMAGLQARIPAGPVGLNAGILGWTGRFEEAGFAESAPFHGVRLTLGVGR